MIDYKLLGLSTEFYEAQGFTRVEVPWLVSKGVADITRPEGSDEYFVQHNKKCLVGSAEQSFLYQYLKGFLPKGRYQAITPCFRSDSFDMIHTKTFMKNELIDTIDVSESSLFDMLNTAQRFFESIGIHTGQVKTDHLSYDLVWYDDNNEIELGSYGIRTTEFLTWIYGTGCAEPRTSYVLNKIK